MNRRFWMPALLVAGAMLSGLAAAPAPDVTTSSMWVDFEGAAEGIGGEPVLLMGRAHVVTQVVRPDGPPSRIAVHANLAGAYGVGLVTGLPYRATGASFEEFLVPEGPPVLPPFTLGFRLQPDGPPSSPPDPIFPLLLRFELDFNELGNLVGAEAFVHIP